VQNVAAGDVVEVNRGERLARHNLHPVAGGVGAEGETALGVGSLEDAINSLEESHEDSVLRDGEGARVAGVVVTPFVENIRAVQRGCGDGDLRVGEIVALALHGAPVGHAGVEFDVVAPVLGEEGGERGVLCKAEGARVEGVAVVPVVEGVSVGRGSCGDGDHGVGGIVAAAKNGTQAGIV